MLEKRPRKTSSFFAGFLRVFCSFSFHFHFCSFSEIQELQTKSFCSFSEIQEFKSLLIFGIFAKKIKKFFATGSTTSFRHVCTPWRRVECWSPWQ